MRFFNFLNDVFLELAKNGKLFIGYLIMQVPGLTDYPGLVTAVEEFLNDPTQANAVAKLILQIFLAGSAGHRVAKILGATFKIKKLDGY